MNTKQLFLNLLICSLIFLNSCKQNKETSQENSLVENITSEEIILPKITLDAEQFGEHEIKNDHPLSNIEVKDLEIFQIDSIRNRSDYPELKYYLLKEIYKGNEGKVLLISRVYEMENYAWLVSYNQENKLVDFKTVFYDEFAESASQITTIIENNKIKINQYNLDIESGNETNELKTFYIDNTLKFQLNKD